MKREQGMSLVVSMLMLAALAVITLSAARIALQEEKSARAERDRQIAMQAAQAALLDAELDIEISARSTLFAPDKAGDRLGAGCDGDRADFCLGLYRQSGPASRPAWLGVDFTGEKAESSSVPYGRFTGKTMQTGAGPLPVYPPRYVIELLAHDEGKTQDSARYYRITAIGFGTRAATQVVLQTLYRKAGENTMMPAGRTSWREIPNWKELRDALAQK